MNIPRYYMECKVSIALIFIGLTFFSCNRTSSIDPSQKETFIKYYGGGSDQKAGQVIQTSDGGYVVVGSSNSFKANGDYDQYVVRVDANGNVVWSKTFGDRGDDYARAVKLLPDGNYGIIGDRMIPGNGDKSSWSTLVNFLKINDLGVLVNGPTGKLFGDTLDASFNTRPRGRSSGNDIAVLENQNLIFVGNSTYTGTINSDNFTNVFIGRFDLNGNLLSKSIFGNYQNDNMYSIAINEPLFYMSGYTQDLFLDKVRVAAFPTSFSNGDQLGKFNYFTTANQTVPAPGTPLPETQTTKAVSILNDKSAFLLTGMRNNKPFIDKKELLQGIDILVFSNITFPFASTQAQSNSIIQAVDGNYIITGYTLNADGNKDVFLAKINSSTGAVIWAKNFGGTSDDEGVDVKQTTDGGYIISANIGFGTNNNVIGLIKVKSDGTLK